MRRDNWDDTSGPEHEAFALRLLDGVRRLFLDLSLIPVNQRILPHATARYPCKKLLRFEKRRICFPVMPIYDLKLVRIEQ